MKHFPFSPGTEPILPDRFRGLRMLCLALMVMGAGFPLPELHAKQTGDGHFRAEFFQLCDLAALKVREPLGITEANGRPHYFVDSYAIRALCAAYDMTARKDYLDACREWSERMVELQSKMTPAGAYYMHYGRKPGQTNGDWFVADSASIGMAVLATSVRCPEAEQKRLVDSVKQFADLVIARYVKPSGGVTDGLWSASKDEWWCSSATFGSMLFNLYGETGEKKYLDTAWKIVDWLNKVDLTKDQAFPLSMQGPGLIMYVMECYSAGWPYLAKGNRTRKAAALKKIDWCLKWTEEQQQKPVSERPWAAATGWGMKFGGLPFHEYIFAHYVSKGQKLADEADREMRQLGAVVFDGKPKLTQLSVFMMMSYAERLEPGAIYKYRH